MKRRALFPLFGLLLTGTAGAAPLALDQSEALRLSQAAVGREVGDYALLDRQSRPVRLSDYRGRPLLVSFIYTGCFQVCPGTTRALQKAVAAAREVLGNDRFQVLSIGFNQPADSPGALRAFAAQQGISEANWEFLSPSGLSMEALARDFGFSYLATPAGFDHTLQVSLVDGQGRIYRQIYGDSFSAEQLVDPLKQLISGTPRAEDTPLARIVEQVRLFCSVYDPLTGKYKVSYGLVFEIAGGITFLLWIIGFFLLEWWKQRGLRRRASA